MVRLKGQFQEMLGFIALAVVISIFIVLQSGSTELIKGKTLELQTGLHEREDLRSGAAVVLSSTYGDTGITIMELVGLAAFTGNTTLDFGPVIGTVNVAREIEKRMDALYGRGKWSVYIPFPEELGDIQVAIVSDTSGSMCDDIANMRDNLPKIVSSLKTQGRKTELTLYLLPGLNTCFINGVSTPLSCTGLGFPETSDFNCRPADAEPLRGACTEPTLRIKSSEDWAIGGACAARYGPAHGTGWRDGTVRIVMPLSDELTSGSECGQTPGGCNIAGCSSRVAELDTLVGEANANNVKVFPLIANPCGIVCGYSGSPTTCEDYSNPSSSSYFICACGTQLLPLWMSDVAARTSGLSSSLANSTGASDAIAGIIGSVKKEETAIKAGADPSTPLRQKPPIARQAQAAPVPVSSVGKYTTAFFYKWS